MKIVQTAGRAALGEFAPEFAHFNDDVLFGENWNNQDMRKILMHLHLLRLWFRGISNWQAMTKYAISIRCIRGREKNITGVRIVWRVPGTRQECFPRQSIILSDLISNDLI